MRATQVTARGKVEFVEAPEPTLKPGHAIVRPLLVALCGSDIHRIHYAEDHQYPHAVGTPGHEMVGIVEAVDAPGYDIKPGDVALTLSPFETVMCERYLSEAQYVIKLPPGVPLDRLLMAQQLGTAIYSSKRLPNIVGKDVAVIGQGSAGLFLAYMCKRMGAERVIGLDLVAARAAAGALFGATHTVDTSQRDPVDAVREITGGRMADLVIEAAGDESAINLTPRLVRHGGHMHFFGIPRGQVFAFNFDTFFRVFGSTTTLSGTSNEPGLRSFRQAVQMIASGEIDVTPMLTHRLPFARALDGFDLAMTRRDGAIKIVIEMPAWKSYVAGGAVGR